MEMGFAIAEQVSEVTEVWFDFYGNRIHDHPYTTNTSRKGGISVV